MDDRTGLVHDFTKKRGVVFTEVALPAHAPPEYADRNVLWNAVEKAEKKSNAQLAREIEVALPKELSRECQIEIVRRYEQDNFVSVGMCADWALHDKGDGNPHAHIMLTMRGIKPDGTWAQKEKKIYALDEDGNRIPLIDPATGEQKLGKRNEKLWKRITVEPNDWNEHSKAEIWRKSWADICNEYLSLEQQIDHRSYKRQELDLEPTIHEGYRARKIFNYFIKLLNPTIGFAIADIERVPFKEPKKDLNNSVIQMVSRIVDIKEFIIGFDKKSDFFHETEIQYGIDQGATTIEEAYNLYSQKYMELCDETDRLQEELDNIFYDIYNISEEEKSIIEENITGRIISQEDVASIEKTCLSYLRYQAYCVMSKETRLYTVEDLVKEIEHIIEEQFDNGYQIIEEIEDILGKR